MDERNNLGKPGVKVRERVISTRPSDGGLTGPEKTKLLSAKNKADAEYRRLHPVPEGRIPIPVPPSPEPTEDSDFNLDFNEDFAI